MKSTAIGNKCERKLIYTNFVQMLVLIATYQLNNSNACCGRTTGRFEYGIHVARAHRERVNPFEYRSLSALGLAHIRVAASVPNAICFNFARAQLCSGFVPAANGQCIEMNQARIECDRQPSSRRMVSHSWAGGDVDGPRKQSPTVPKIPLSHTIQLAIHITGAI